MANPSKNRRPIFEKQKARALRRASRWRGRTSPYTYETPCQPAPRGASFCAGLRFTGRRLAWPVERVRFRANRAPCPARWWRRAFCWRRCDSFAQHAARGRGWSHEGRAQREKRPPQTGPQRSAWRRDGPRWRDERRHDGRPRRRWAGRASTPVMQVVKDVNSKTGAPFEAPVCVREAVDGVGKANEFAASEIVNLR